MSRSRSHWLKARVPGCIHTDLFRHKRIPDPFWGSNEKELQWIEERDWEYRCRFAVEPRFCDHEHIELVAEGLDTIASIRLNGHNIGSTENMFLGHRFDVKQAIRAGRNILEIRFGSPHALHPRPQETRRLSRSGTTRWEAGRSIRKEQCSFGWDWGPRFATCGVYKPMRLEAWRDNRFETVRIRQRHEAGRVAASIEAQLASEGDEIRGVVCQERPSRRRNLQSEV